MGTVRGGAGTLRLLGRRSRSPASPGEHGGAPLRCAPLLSPPVPGMPRMLRRCYGDRAPPPPGRAGPPQHRAAPPRGGRKFGASPGGLCPALGSVPGRAAGRRTREVSPAPRSGLTTRKPGAKCLFSLTTPPVVSLFLLQLSQLIASLLQLP